MKKNKWFKTENEMHLGRYVYEHRKLKVRWCTIEKNLKRNEKECRHLYSLYKAYIEGL